MTTLRVDDDSDIIDLDSLIRPVGRVRVFARVHDVLPIDGASADLLDQLAKRESSGNVALQYARTIVRQVCPSLPADEVARMSIEQLTQTVAIAGERLDQVRAVIEKIEGNVGEPVVAEVATPAPEPTTKTSVPSEPRQKSSSPSRRRSSE